MMHHRSVLAGVVAAALALAVTGCSTEAPGSGGGAGVGPGVAERPSEPFVPSDEVGKKPDVTDRVAAAMNVVNVEVFSAFSKAMEDAAKHGGMDFRETAANNDPAKSIEQLNSLKNQGVGAVFVWDVDVASQRPVEKEIMDTGAAVFTLSSGPSTMPMVANQVDMGDLMAGSAIDYINQELGGKARVAIFNLDKLVNIKPRYDEVRRQLKALPGVEIVSDVTWEAEDADFGFKTMNSILQAHPDVNVVIGDDPVVVSALSAVEAARVDSSRMAFIGAGGASEALAKVKEGGPYKVSFAFNFSVLGYGAGVWGANWIEGKQIPALTLIKAVPLDSAAAIDEYNADVADPEATFNNKLDKYLELYGNISYETRDQYWNEANPQ